ncbi:zinc finger protein 184-like [Hippoglossus stenolepis]|uniref:zinc finger protein 184-like n=1 Tax=Hippoglossus stenolepis TaxID=195615 RepID=UPI001FAEB2AD|nr:zinc finger protein 184-like [Hippoglossus stenolepis]
MVTSGTRDPVMLSGTQLLRVLLSERLEAAAQEIFRLVEKHVSAAGERLQVDRLQGTGCRGRGCRERLQGSGCGWRGCRGTGCRWTGCRGRGCRGEAAGERLQVERLQVDRLQGERLQETGCRGAAAGGEAAGGPAAGSGCRGTGCRGRGCKRTGCGGEAAGERLQVERLQVDRLQGRGCRGEAAGGPAAGERLQGERLQGDRLQGDRLQGDRLQGDRLTSATDAQFVSEEAFPSQLPDQVPTVEKTETSEPQQVKEEQVDLCIKPELEADSSEPVEVKLSGSNTRTDRPLSPSLSELTVTLGDDGEWEGSGSSGSSSGALPTGRGRAQKDKKVCRFCRKQFNRDSALIRHMEERHLGEKAFKCTDCDRQFSRRDHLAVHLRIHTGEKPHMCPFCAKTFAQSSNLNRHLRGHTGEKPYFCESCGEMVANSYHLKTCGTADPRGERSFRCLVCGKKFKTAMKLRGHVKIHEARKPPHSTVEPSADDTTELSFHIKN